MSNYLWDLITRAAKSNSRAQKVPSKEMSAADYNALLSDLNDLREAFLNGELRPNPAGATGLSPSGAIRFRVTAGNLQLSENGGNYAPLSIVRSLESFGAAGDGTTDDGPALQAYFDFVAAGGPCALRLSRGKRYSIATTVATAPGITHPFLLEGDVGGGPSASPPALVWNGSNGGTMLHTAGAWGYCFRNIIFDGNAKAGKLVHIDNDNNGVFAASNTGLFDHCSFLNVRQSGTPYGVALASAGVGANGQVSEVVFQNCMFYGGSNNLTGPYFGYGVGNLTAGNCKNFWFVGCQFTRWSHGIHLTGSGGAVASVSNTVFTECKKGIYGSAVHLQVSSVGMETADNLAAMFIDAGTTSTPASLSVVDSYAAIGCDTDDWGIRGTCPTYIRNCEFRNNRTASSEFKVVTAAGLLGSGDSSAAPRASIQSHGNWYYNAPLANPYASIYDTSGNHLIRDEYACTTGGPLVESWGDWGLPADGSYSPFYLRPTVGYAPEVRRNALSFQATYPATVVRSGQSGRSKHIIDIDTTALATVGAAVVGTLQVAKAYAKWKVVDAKLEVITPFAGVGLTALTISLGPTGAAAGYLKAANVMASAGTVYGLLDVELGILLDAGGAVGGGHIPSWTSTVIINVTAAATGANLNALSAGKVRLYLVTEGMD